MKKERNPIKLLKYNRLKEARTKGNGNANKNNRNKE
jgi:hypothetical protein